jgi:hypothetical protein
LGFKFKKKKECQQLERAQMITFRTDKFRQSNEYNNLRKTKADHIVDEIQNYQKTWLQHVKMMEHSRIPRMALEYQPKGKRDIGRPKTRWRDQAHLQD